MSFDMFMFELIEAWAARAFWKFPILSVFSEILTLKEKNTQTKMKWLKYTADTTVYQRAVSCILLFC